MEIIDCPKVIDLLCALCGKFALAAFTGIPLLDPELYSCFSFWIPDFEFPALSLVEGIDSASRFL